MNTPELFIMGAVVTLIVGAALALVLYGAVMDGRAARGARLAADAAEAAPAPAPEPPRDRVSA